MIHRPITIWCDGLGDNGNCNTELETNETTLDRALSAAKQAGWTHSHRFGEDRCPEHTDAKRKEQARLHGAARAGA